MFIFQLSLVLSLKKNSVFNESSNLKDESVNPIVKEIQEKCYEDLMDVCRGLAASLEINTSAVMSMQVGL